MGSSPFGSSAFADTRSTAPTGHDLRAPFSAAGCLGVHDPPPRRRLAWGSTTPIMAPSGGPPKTGDLQGKKGRVRGSVPFGGSNRLVCLLAAATSTATTGAWPSPTTTASAWPGSTMAIMAPSGGPLKTAGLQGKSRSIPGGPCPLGAGMDSSAFCGNRVKYCHNGGMALAHQHRSGWRGVQEGDHGPLRRSPESRWFAGKKPAGFGVRALWGRRCARLRSPGASHRGDRPRGVVGRPPATEEVSLRRIAAPKVASCCPLTSRACAWHSISHVLAELLDNGVI
jgi:hypothetical protein